MTSRRVGIVVEPYRVDRYKKTKHKWDIKFLPAATQIVNHWDFHTKNYVNSVAVAYYNDEVFASYPNHKPFNVAINISLVTNMQIIKGESLDDLNSQILKILSPGYCAQGEACPTCKKENDDFQKRKKKEIKVSIYEGEAEENAVKENTRFFGDVNIDPCELEQLNPSDPNAQIDSAEEWMKKLDEEWKKEW